MSFLPKLTLARTTSLTVIIILFIVIALTAKSVITDRNNIALANHIKILSETALAFDNYSHNNAVERGLSAGYLGNPSATALTKLQTQRDINDQALVHLQDALTAFPKAYTDLQASFALLFNKVSLKKTIRRNVDNVDGTSMFSYYSTVNRLALDAIAAITTQISDRELSLGYNNALYLAKYNEALGQLRGPVNGVLSKQLISPIVHASIKQFLIEKDINNFYIEQFLTPSLLLKFQQQLNSADAKLVDLAATLITQNQTAIIDSNLNADEWFASISTLIGGVKHLVDSQWQANQALANTTAQSLHTQFWVLIGVIVLLLSILVLLNKHMLTSLKSQLVNLTGIMDRVAQEGDLTTEIDTNAAKELGQLSSSIVSSFSVFKQLLIKLGLSVAEQKSLSQDFNQSTQVVAHEAKRTHELATSIATATEEMTLTSQEIAKSAF